MYIVDNWFNVCISQWNSIEGLIERFTLPAAAAWRVPCNNSARNGRLCASWTSARFLRNGMWPLAVNFDKHKRQSSLENASEGRWAARPWKHFLCTQTQLSVFTWEKSYQAKPNFHLKNYINLENNSENYIIIQNKEDVLKKKNHPYVRTHLQSADLIQLKQGEKLKLASLQKMSTRSETFSKNEISGEASRSVNK